MTEHVAIDRDELILAREAPFSLAGTQVRPAALEVEHGGVVTPLEPRVMKVLVALHRSRGQPVSRDELIELCWGGRIVTEGALNRCAAQLRKALASNPRIRIDTIATVGYRLQATAEVHPLGTAAAALVQPVLEAARPRIQPRWLAAAAVGVLALATGGALWAAMPRPVTWTAAAYHPVTSELGLETHPALSPDGGQLIYAQRDDVTQQRDLYLRSVASGTPVRLTTDPGDDYAPVWSPAGDRVAFVRNTPSQPCRLVVIPIPLGPERVVGRCQSAIYTKVSWLDADTLVFSDRPTHDGIRRVRAVDIRSGATRDLTAPPASTLGDGDPVVSPDGRYIVYRRSLMHGADDLFLKDVRTGKERALTTDGWKAVGYVWSADSRHVFYSSNRGGEFGLWTVDTKIAGEPRRVSLGLGQVSFSRMSADSQNRLAVETSSGRTNLARFTPSGQTIAVTNTASGSDWDPRVAADGGVVFVSDRSGASEIWVAEPDGRAVQLTSIVGSYVNSPAWSPDGRSIAFVAVKGRRSDINLVDRDGSRLRTITHDGHDKLSPVFSADGRSVTYVRRDGEGYRLVEVNLADGRSRELPGGAGWREIRRAPDGRLFGIRNDGFVRAVADGAPTAVSLRADDTWTVGSQGVYVLRARTAIAPAVWIYPWTGEPRRIVELPYTSGRIGIGADGSVVFSRDLDDQVDLGILDLKS